MGERPTTRCIDSDLNNLHSSEKVHRLKKFYDNLSLSYTVEAALTIKDSGIINYS